METINNIVITESLVEKVTDWQGFWAYNSLVELGKENPDDYQFSYAKTLLRLILRELRIFKSWDLCLPYSIHIYWTNGREVS